MEAMTLYLAGPMTGRPDWNYPAFHAAAARLRALGHTVVNPAESFDGQTDLPYRAYMRRDLQDLLRVDGVVFLPEWETSRGATFERQVAHMLDLPCWAYADGAELTPLPPLATAPAPAAPGAGWKDTNPKDGIGATKAPLALVPVTALTEAALAHLDGALKYGAWNWRIAGARASIYVDAAMRHLLSWYHGESRDPDSEVSHLGHAIACCNILLDAAAVGQLVDDRPPSEAALAEGVRTAAGRVRALRDAHADKAPRHYTIADPIGGRA